MFRIFDKTLFKIIPLLLALVMSCSVWGQDFVTVNSSGDGFCYQGKDFRFIGINAPKLHWDPGTVNWSAQDIQHVISQAAAMNAKVIRIFLARNTPNYNAASAIRDLNRLLGYMQNYPEMKLLIAMTDVFQDQQMFLPADDNYFYLGPNNRMKLNHTWFDYGYQINYLPFVLEVVRAFKDEPRIFAWELGNELQDTVNASTIIDFALDVGGRIDALASQMVTTGFANVQNATRNYAQFASFYNAQSPFDFVVVHGYNDEDWHDQAPFNFSDQDIDRARAAGIPFVVEEYGLTGNCGHKHCPPCPGGPITWRGTSIPTWSSGRTLSINAMLHIFFNTLGASGVMQWAFTPGGDVGYGDICVGLNASTHADYQAVYQHYQIRGNILALEDANSSCSQAQTCVDYEVINHPIFFRHEEYQVSNDIYMYSNLYSNASLSLTADGTIYLKHGFRAREGSTFRAYHSTCPPPSKPSYSIDAIFKNQTPPAGLETAETLDATAIQVFPNPTSGIVTLAWDKRLPTVHVRVLTTTGQVVHDQQVAHHPQVQLDLSPLPAGLYFIRLQAGSQPPATLRVAKE